MIIQDEIANLKYSMTDLYEKFSLLVQQLNSVPSSKTMAQLSAIFKTDLADMKALLTNMNARLQAVEARVTALEKK